jgi:hypothetical protein
MPLNTDPVMFAGDRLMLNDIAAGVLHYEFSPEVRERAQQIIR